MPHRRQRQIEIEAAIAAGDRHARAGITSMGKPSPFTCPDCHGTLFGLSQEVPLMRYRCHTGHAFTTEALLCALQDSTEKALWNAVRTLQEKAILLHHMARHAEHAGDVERASELSLSAEQATAAADRLRDVEQVEI